MSLFVPVLFRILLDKADATALELSDCIETKVKEWFPFSEIEEDTVKQLIDESEDVGTLERGLKDFQSLYLVGNKGGSVYSGLESQGLCTFRLQLQGQRLVALASASELLDFYKKRSVREALQHFEAMNGDAADGEPEVPDCWVMPSLSFEFVRTGHALFCPAGMVVIEKAIEASVSVRPGLQGLRDRHDTNTHIHCYLYFTRL